MLHKTLLQFVDVTGHALHLRLIPNFAINCIRIQTVRCLLLHNYFLEIYLLCYIFGYLALGILQQLE